MDVIGTGRLSWWRKERVTDRYGAVSLHDLDTGMRQLKLSPEAKALAGKKGTLIAEVLATRQSEHIGDMFRGLRPVTPEVGERIVLGTGTVFIQIDEDRGEIGENIGLRPDDGRKSDWLDPRALYRAHEQTVRLVFEEATATS